MGMLSILRKLAPPFKPTQPGHRATWWLPRSQAGVTVSQETALTLSAYWRCVRAISETIAALDWRVFRMRQDGGQDLALGNKCDQLLNRSPNPEMTPFTFKETIVSHALSWGNGYAFIERDGSGKPVRLWPLPPWRVQVEAGENQWDKRYLVSDDQRGVTVYPSSAVFHLMNLSDTGMAGMSVAAIAAKSLGLSLATESYGAAFFENGTRPSGLLKHPGKLNDEARTNLRDSWQRLFRGPAKAHGTAILEEGMDYVPTGMPNEDAQFLETRKFQVIEICRWFGVPPHKVYELDRATFSNIEHQDREYAMTTILPWVTRLEQEANAKLIGQEVLFSKFNLKTLLRGDVTTQTLFYQAMTRIGALSINEVRNMEDMNPIDDGDEYFVDMNRQTLEQAMEEPEPMPFQQPPGADSNPESPDNAPGDDTPGDTEDSDELSALRGVFVDAVHRIIRREKNIAQDLAKRYENRDQFLGAMAVQLQAKRFRMYQDLEAPLKALAVATGGDTAWMSNVHSWFSDAHGKHCLQEVQDHGGDAWANDRGHAEVVGGKLYRYALIASKFHQEDRNG